MREITRRSIRNKPRYPLRIYVQDNTGEDLAHPRRYPTRAASLTTTDSDSPCP